MIILLPAVFVGAWLIGYLGLVVADSRDKHGRDRELLGMAIFFLGIPIFIATSIVAAQQAHITEIYEPTMMRQNIVSIADGSSNVSGEISGGIFITSGYINSQPVYTYYMQEADGAIIQGQLNASKAKIYEDTEQEGYITWLECKHVKGNYRWLPFRSSNCSEYPRSWKTFDKKNFEIHVPPGSVVRHFTLDAE